MVMMRHFALRLEPDPSRVVIRPFHIAPEPRDLNAPQMDRVRRVLAAVDALSREQCEAELDYVNADFTDRHWQTREVYLRRYEQMVYGLSHNVHCEAQRELIGAYFCHEYSYAAAAVMNPSVVPHPDQSGLPTGATRFVMSLRTVGEGHISSVSFREGILTAENEMALWPQPSFSMALEEEQGGDGGEIIAHRPSSAPISGAVIFPFTRAQRNGIEDMRLVRFEEADRPARYFGTYTAYSGMAVGSELMTTSDFTTFSLAPMRGSASVNKGMALFPGRIGGAYAMIGRQDGESLYYLESDDLLDWNGGDLITRPTMTWELIQIGNCGSPIELDEGWLLLTHGVGAMRKYAIGAMLLDKKNPRRILARLNAPLLSPSKENREGYVPNVLYTCGGMKHGGQLFLPYAVADSSVRFCLIDLKSLLGAMSEP